MQENQEEVPVKTANTILMAMCAVLEQADKLAKDTDISEKTVELRHAITNLPPSDVTTLLHHIQSMYSACEGMRITRIAYKCDTEGKRVVAIIGIQFGVREIELFAPFDSDGAKNMLRELVGSLDLLEPARIILPGEGIA